MLDCRVLTSSKEVEDIAAPWRDLHACAGANLFSNYDFYKIWWDEIAVPKKGMPLVVTGWRQDRLVAILPLVIYRQQGLRVLFWAGKDVHLGNMALAEKQEDLKALWQQVHSSKMYDVAVFKFIEPLSLTHKMMSLFPLSLCVEDSMVMGIHLDDMKGKEGAENRARYEMRSKKKKLEKKGKITFTPYKDETPDLLVKKMIEHKKAWCLKTKTKGTVVLQNDAYFLKFIEKAAACGAMRFFSFNCGDQPISFNLCFAEGKTLYWYMTAHDPAWAKHSPSIIATTEMILWAVDNEFDEVNFMEGRQAYKTLYANYEKLLLTYALCHSLKGLFGWLFLLMRYRFSEYKEKRQFKLSSRQIPAFFNKQKKSC